MPGTEQQQPTFHFGVFELNPNIGELRKHGLRLKLQDQALQILKILLERPGELITREEIQKRLWPDGTYVDFDNAINSAVRKLRDALGDTPSNPRFIETLARRGYRFIGAVSATPRASGVAPQTSPERDEHAAAIVMVEPKPMRQMQRSWGIICGLGAVFLLAAIGIGLWVRKSDDSGRESPLPAVPLTGNPGYEAFPAFSPEGSRVAYAWDEAGKHSLNIYVKLIGPGEPVRLTSGAKGDFGPAWSHDGRYIAFLRARDPLHANITIVPSIGGPERELTDIVFNNDSALRNWKSFEVPPPFLAWSGDDKGLLSVELRTPGEATSVIRVSVDTGEKRVITSPPMHGGGDGAIALAPDGRVLAFTRTLGALERDIYLLPVSADLTPLGEPKRLTFDRKEIEGLAWSADGRNLMFSSKRGGRRELWKVPITSRATPVRLTAAGDDPRDIAISRDGHHLVYSHQILDWNIWRTSLDGKAGQHANSFISSTRLEYHGTYSPDGQRIAFESNRSGNEEIWTATADGSNPVQLTSFRDSWVGSPKWSPDGQKIAFDGDAGGNWDIYVIGSHGGKPIRLTTNHAEEFRPSWSRDGKWIYYCSTRTEHREVWKVPAAGGEEVQVTKNGGCIPLESRDGEDLYYTKEETGLWKMPVRGGPEAKVLNRLFQQNFAPARNGLYFLDAFRTDETEVHLKFLDFKKREIRTIAAIPGPVGDEISISPDEQWMLFYRPDHQGSELMLIENFR